MVEVIIPVLFVRESMDHLYNFFVRRAENDPFTNRKFEDVFLDLFFKECDVIAIQHEW